MVFMRFFVLATILMCGVSVSAYAQAVESGDVRGLVWGLSMADVQAFEASNPDLRFIGPYDNVLAYSGYDRGMEAYVNYAFYGGKLARVDIEYRDINTNPQDNLNDYILLKDDLTRLYGRPVDDKLIWKGKTYRDDPERWGLAVLMGELAFESAWSTPRSFIRLNFKGDDLKYTLKAMYISKTVVSSEEPAVMVPEALPMAQPRL